MTQKKHEVEVDLLVGILEECGAGEKLLNDGRYLEEVLRRAADAGWFTLFQIAVQEFEPQGISGVAIIGESHICIHTWPEWKAAFVDVGSCIGARPAKLAWDSIVKDLRPARVSCKRTSVSAHEPSGQQWAPT